MATFNINITRSNDINPDEVAYIIHDYMVDDDFDAAHWAVEHAIQTDVTMFHMKPGLRDAIKANGLCTFVSITSVD